MRTRFPPFIKGDRQSWSSLQRKYPQKSIKQLREAEKALYMRLYRNDREWLKANSPKPLKRTSSERIDWNKRDEEILGKVRETVKNLLNSDGKPVRITIGKVGYLIRERALLEKKLGKLPKTKAYLEKRIETIEEFQERRILYTIKQFKVSGEELAPWKIIRRSGIKDYNKWTEFVNSHADLDN